MPHSHGDICIYCLNVNTPISSWISTKEIPSSLFLDDVMTWALGYWLNSHCNRSPCQIWLFRLILQRALLLAAVCKLRIAKIPPKFFLRTDLEKHHHIPGIQIKKTKKKHELFIHLCLCISEEVLEQMPAEDTQFSVFSESLGFHVQLLPTDRKESNSSSSGAPISQV